MRRPPRTQKGFALILVIWALVLLVSLGSGFSYALRHEVRAASDLETTARAEAAATAALHATVLKLAERDPDLAWQADGLKRQVRWPDANIDVTVTPESGRIDINRAPPDVLLGLFTQFFAANEAERLSDAVIDWRDKDDDPRPDGAERREYATAGLRGPANAPFSSVRELRQVLGFNRQVVEAVADYLTVYSGTPRIDASSADLVALLSVPGIDRDVAEQFIAQRDSGSAGDMRASFRLLRKGSRYLVMGGKNAVLAIDIDILLDNGFARRERAVIRLVASRGFNLMARESVPIDGTDEGQER